MLAVDLGNRFIKLANQGRVWALESIYAHVQEPEDRAVHYRGGSQAELVGKSWVVGHQARNYRWGIRTWMGEKHEAALRLVLGSLRYAGEDLELDLVMSLPDLRDRELLQNGMLGEHHLVVHGDPVVVRICSVRIEPEGMGIYRYGLSQGLTVPRSLTGVLDLGGGTAIATLVDEWGSQIEGARLVLRRGGAYGLASDIAADPRLRKQVVGTPRVELILDGIASGTLAYGVQGASFADFFHERLDLWLKGIVSELLNRWDPWLEEVGTVLVAGGAAPLFSEWLGAENGWFKVLPNPQFAQVLGLGA